MIANKTYKPLKLGPDPHAGASSFGLNAIPTTHQRLSVYHCIHVNVYWMPNVQPGVVFEREYQTVQQAARYGTVRHGTPQHSTAQHSTAQHSTAHYTVQYNTVPYRPVQSEQYGTAQYCSYFCAQHCAEAMQANE